MISLCHYARCVWLFFIYNILYVMAIPFIQDMVISVDIVIFSIVENKLCVFLLYRDKEPYIWSWALPWSPVLQHEEMEVTVSRMLFEKTGLKRVFAKQFGVFDEVARDPRGRTVSVSYISIVQNLQQEKWAMASLFFPLRSFPDLAFDHKKIILKAYDNLKEQLDSGIIAHFLEKEFTLTELQKVYELVYGYTMDVRNFRKKILWSGIIKLSKGTKKNWAHRPAQLYQFVRMKT